MMKKLKPIPKFKDEDEEREFWANHSAVDYLDLSQARRVEGLLPPRKQHLD